MEAQRFPSPLLSLKDQPVQLSCLQAIPAVSNFSLSPVILQPEQGLSQTIYLKALTIPLYQPIQSECFQPNSQLPTGPASISLEHSNMPLILNPLVHSERPGQLQPATQNKQSHTISLVSGLPVLPQNPSPSAPLLCPGKSKSARKYLCKRCGRDCLKPSVLEKHMRSHTGERPFPCTTCGIAFKTQSNLYKHRRTLTHVNNTRLPSESDNRNLLDENEKVTENVLSTQATKADDRESDYVSATAKQPISETNPSEKHPLDTALPTTSALSLWMTMDDAGSAGVSQNILEKLPMKDPVRRKLQEQRSPIIGKHSQLQRQQATYSEKLWDSRSSEFKLKKCESTDSGYLSRSDSVEQQMLSPGPLRSLCEHSTESESGSTISNFRGTAGNSSKLDLSEKATEALEKKKLEEHISKLISHNKAVVDDTQLDNVRPRKTVLSKQGSIDLPMPYTYKDSFHFDIRPVYINRKKNLSLCSAKSTFTPVEKPKPLFFHSVPTQFSTTVDSVPVTRSNSLPFVENTRRKQDQVDSSKLYSFTRLPPNTNSSGLLHSNNFAASPVDFPTSHPRALVRQAAVDDLPLSNMIESSSPASEESKDTKKSGARAEGANAKHKKSRRRKLKMFSQEKWQVYGDETFKKIYQKMKCNQASKDHKGGKTMDISNIPCETKETASHQEVPLPRDGRSPSTRVPASSPVAISTKQNTEESDSRSTGRSMLQSTSSKSKESPGSFAESMETSLLVGDGEASGMTLMRLGHKCRDPSSNTQMRPLSTDCDLRAPFYQTLGQDKDNASVKAADLQKCGKASEETCAQGECVTFVAAHEDLSASRGGGKASGKESFSPSLSLPHCNNSEPVQESPKLPSDKKKLKVDELKSKENTVLEDCGPSRLADRTDKLPDNYKILSLGAPVSDSVKGEKQKLMPGTETSSKQSSMESEKVVQRPIITFLNRENILNLPDTEGVSALSFSVVTKEYSCNSYASRNLAETTCPMVTGTRILSQGGDMEPTSSSIQPLLQDRVTSDLLKRNEFLPKYILKYPQEGNSAGTPLILAEEPENMSCISLPSTLANTFHPAGNNKSLDNNSADVFLYPLQLELNHPDRTKELNWDEHKTWASLVACSPAILETTSITTMVDKRCHHSSARQKEKVQDTQKDAENRDTLGDEKPVQEHKRGTVVGLSSTAGKEICFTSMYTGEFFISSHMAGQNSALQLIQSRNSSVISVASLVETTDLYESPGEKMKAWKLVNSFRELPTCHSSDMLYCHVLCTQQKEVCTMSKISHAGNLKIPSLNLAFPTLNAETRLTWCCLTRNLPLPVEQKEKKYSAYSALHTCKNENASQCDLSSCKMNDTRKAVSEGLATGTPDTPMSICCFCGKEEKQNFSTTGGDGLLKIISEQEKAKGNFCKLREVTLNKAKRNRKRKKVKGNPKRYKGSYGHRHMMLKTNRTNKPSRRTLETPKQHLHPLPSDSHKHCGKCLCLPVDSPGKDQPQPQEPSCAATAKAASPVKMDWMKELRRNSGTTFSSIDNSSNLRQNDPVDEQGGSRPPEEYLTGNIPLQRIATAPDRTATTHSCLLATKALIQKASSLNICSLSTNQKGQQPDTHSDHPWRSTGTCNFEFIAAGKSHPCTNACPQVSHPIFVGSKLNYKHVLQRKAPNQNFAVLQPLVHVPERKELMEASLYSSLNEQLAPSIQTPTSVPLSSKLFTETSVSSNCLPSSSHAQETNSTLLCLGGADKNSSCLQDDRRKMSETAVPTFQNPTTALASTGVPPKSYKKESLEKLNKQTHVESEDTSSDDEDRLIIEI